MNIIYLFLSLFFIVADAFNEKNIFKHVFNLCEKTDVSIEFPKNCLDLPTFEMLKCEIFKNDLQVILKFEDQFNFLNAPNETLVVYSLNRILFLASCVKINELRIPEKVNRCTRDIPVIVSSVNKSEEIVYLTREGILRHDSIDKDCSSDYEFFEFSDISIIRQENLIKLIERKMKKLFFFGTNEKTKLQENNYQSFLKFYRKFFSTNELFLIFRDITFILLLSIFFTIIVLIIFIKSKQPIKDFIIFFLLILQNIRKKKQESSSNKLNTACLSENYASDKIQPFQDTFDNINETNNETNLKRLKSIIDLSARSVVRSKANNIVNESKSLCGLNADRCNCKAGCKDKRCPCKQQDLFCNSNCHGGATCLNN